MCTDSCIFYFMQLYTITYSYVDIAIAITILILIVSYSHYVGEGCVYMMIAVFGSYDSTIITLLSHVEPVYMSPFSLHT